MTLDELYSYVLSLYGISYQWGGNGPFGTSIDYGFDCSGLITHLLQKSGMNTSGLRTADHLYQYFKTHGTDAKQKGSLAFFGISGVAHHVGWMIDDKVMISAAGGDSTCNTATKARLRNAYVKIQPISWYKVPAFIGAYALNASLP